MTIETFDAIKYVNEAIEVGFTRKQAEFQAKSIMNGKTDLITKEYLSNEFKLFEQKMTIKLGLMMIGMVGLLTFLLKHT